MQKESTLHHTSWARYSRTHVGDQALDGRDGVEFDGVATCPDGGLGGRLRPQWGGASAASREMRSAALRVSIE